MSVVERHEHLVELRCPIGPRALLAKVIQQGDAVTRDKWNLLELNCRDCAKKERQTDPRVARVVHRYNILGELVESLVQEKD